MGTPYIGEIRMFGGNFAPQGWMFCDGSLLSIAENDAFFNLIGTTYGGDGQTTFALPDLRGRLPIHQGSNTSGTYILSQRAGTETVTLSQNQLPNHTHALTGSTAAASSRSPVGSVPAATSRPIYGGTPATLMAPNALASTGFNQPQPHDNRQPFLCVNFIISLFGVYPSQN